MFLVTLNHRPERAFLCWLGRLILITKEKLTVSPEQEDKKELFGIQEVRWVLLSCSVINVIRKLQHNSGKDY